MSWTAHVAIVPIVLPLAAGAIMLLIDELNHVVRAMVGLVSLAALLMASIVQLSIADQPVPLVYALGNWPAPFGIVLVVDRLAAMMVFLTSVLGIATFVYSLAHWQTSRGRFAAMLQFLLMGLNGAFLTGDLFNLFVFFELLLAASYGLALHGSGVARVRASLHYIVINLAASLLFLLGISLIYGVTGTLNMAQLAQRIPEVAAADRALVDSGAALLLLAFLVKAAMWPLGFWLPATYSTASAPAAALFAILSKVGIYAVLRLCLLFSSDTAGLDALFYGGIATLVFGACGLLASQSVGRVAGFSLMISSGTLLAAISFAQPAVTAGALFYVATSTLGAAALFLLSELVNRTRPPGADVLAVTAEAFDIDEDEPGEQNGPAIPATMVVLGLSFLMCALLVAGLPPLPGFVAKFSLLTSVLGETRSGVAWTFMAALLLSGLVSIVTLGRMGVMVFWGPERPSPRVLVSEMTPVVTLLGLALALTVAAGPAMRYFQAAAVAVHNPGNYIQSVLPR